MDTTPPQPSMHPTAPPSPPVPVPPPPPPIDGHRHPGPGRTGFGRAVGVLITSLAALGAVFLVGLAAGVLLVVIVGVSVAPAYGSGPNALVERTVWRKATGGGDARIVIIPVRGVIDAGAAEFVRQCVERVLDGDMPDAIVLRVDSPGGGVTASDQIWHEVARFRGRSIPVVASYGGVAASGGYYVSCGSDFIMAEETTITGSIGVIAQVFTMGELAERVGVEPVTLVATGSPRKNVANDAFRAWDDADRAQVTTILDAAYATFRSRVRTGRAAVFGDPRTLDQVADGTVFTAAQALGNGLVDGIGYLDDAIARAEQLAGIAPGGATVVRYHRRAPLLGGLLGARHDGGGGAAAAAGLASLDGARLRSLVNELAQVRLMYLTRIGGGG